MLPIGLLSFDELIAGPPGLGVNYISLQNFTGDPADGGFAIDPDFPVYSAIEFRNLKLTISIGMAELDFALPNLGPGGLGPLAELQFANDIPVDWVRLSGELAPSTLQLASGKAVVLPGESFSAKLLPFNGIALVANSDLAVVSVPLTAVPEPAALLITGLALTFGLSVRSRRRAVKG
jgi:hypothetical protein